MKYRYLSDVQALIIIAKVFIILLTLGRKGRKRRVKKQVKLRSMMKLKKWACTT